MDKNGNGFEYEMVGICRHGKPVLAPKAWSHKTAARPRWVNCEPCNLPEARREALRLRPGGKE